MRNINLGCLSETAEVVVGYKMPQKEQDVLDLRIKLYHFIESLGITFEGNVDFRSIAKIDFNYSIFVPEQFIDEISMHPGIVMMTFNPYLDRHQLDLGEKLKEFHEVHDIRPIYISGDQSLMNGIFGKNYEAEMFMQERP